MKQRITFVHTSNGDFHPKQLNVSSNSFQVKALKAAREEQLTFLSQELLQEISQVLKPCYELHLKWLSALPYPSTAPFLSRTSPGLHILFTPMPNRSVDNLGPLLHKFFGSSNPRAAKEATFIDTRDRSSSPFSPPTYHYHEFLPSLKDFGVYVQNKLCVDGDHECPAAAARLEKAIYLDIDYKAKSRELILTSFHLEPPVSGPWTERIELPPKSVKAEVGVFTPEEAIEPEELSLGGFSSIVGEDTKPKPTRFSFASRHQPLPSTSGSAFLTTFPSPTGLHPIIRLTFPTPISPPAPACTLHTYLTLPSRLFVDKYQLSSPNFLASNNLRAIRSLNGETDLEAPDWVIQKWGSTLLLELAPPAPGQAMPKTADESWHADIPLHLRYLPPAAGGTTSIDVVWPVVFWACPADEETKLDGNPFDRVNLGYEAMFGPQMVFYHLRPMPEGSGGRLVERVRVPVMDLEGMRWVEGGTVGMMVLGALWVVWKLLRVSWRKMQSKDLRTEKKVQ